MKAMIVLSDGPHAKCTIGDVIEKHDNGRQYLVRALSEHNTIREVWYRPDDIILIDEPDSVVSSVIDKFKTRAAIGKAKYNTDMDRKDLSKKDWIEHAQQEAMDLIIYLEKLKSYE